MDERLIDEAYENHLNRKRSSIFLGELYEVPHDYHGPIIRRDTRSSAFTKHWPKYSIRQPTGMFTRKRKAGVL